MVAEQVCDSKLAIDAYLLGLHLIAHNETVGSDWRIVKLREMEVRQPVGLCDALGKQASTGFNTVPHRSLKRLREAGLGLQKCQARSRSLSRPWIAMGGTKRHTERQVPLSTLY